MVQWPLQGVGAGQQGLEGPGGRPGGDHQQGPPQAASGHCGASGSPATATWAAEDDLYVFSGLSGFGEEARGACVADDTVVMPMFVMREIRE